MNGCEKILKSIKVAKDVLLYEANMGKLHRTLNEQNLTDLPSWKLSMNVIRAKFGDVNRKTIGLLFSIQKTGVQFAKMPFWLTLLVNAPYFQKVPSPDNATCLK